MIKSILKVVLTFVASLLLMGKSGGTINEHITEICIAVDTHTFRTPNGDLFEINPNCDNLIVNESYVVVFYTFNTKDRKDDEIVDFNELEIYELSNFKTVKKFEKLD